MPAEKSKIGRRSFLGTAATAALAAPFIAAGTGRAAPSGQKIRIAIVGTGTRGINLWGRTLMENYSDVLDYVGLCDINPKRLTFARKYMGVDCPTFTDTRPCDRDHQRLLPCQVYHPGHGTGLRCNHRKADGH